nr:MAG TPA: hypothetical protein [Caudoviricetes sp.]
MPQPIGHSENIKSFFHFRPPFCYNKKASTMLRSGEEQCLLV